MKKLSDTMKHVTERQDFVKNEELKRIYKKQGFNVPIEEQVYKPHNFLSRDAFVNDKNSMRNSVRKKQTVYPERY